MTACAAPPGRPAAPAEARWLQYHTARFRLVPALAKALNVPTLAIRKPSLAWPNCPARPRTASSPRGTCGSATRASTLRQSLDTQLDALKAAGVTRVFAEKISTRTITRSELDEAGTLARELRAAGVAVTLVVREHKRLGRGLDLAALAEQLSRPGSTPNASPTAHRSTQSCTCTSGAGEVSRLATSTSITCP
ncbi:recombinase family protein [Nonomuraea sp. NPDC049504]|uniref:recombinase family protein n=1 Tax=Nonomuraea sp. NPDC049504 TaxID=3154729 RepID=UPI0034442937